MFGLAVGIVSWNTRELTLACLASLMAELARLDEASSVWVIDNASADGSPEAIAGAYPEVTLVRNADNVGFAAANNQFLRDCEARYYLLLNSDTVVHEGALAALLAEVSRQPGAGAVGPRLILGDGATQRSCWPLPTLSGELRYNLADRFPPFGGLFRRFFSRRLLDMAAIRATMPVEALSMACLLIDQRVLANVGLLSEDYFLFGEENDFFRRANLAGWRGYYVPSATVTHFVGQSRGKQHSHRSQTNFFRSRTLYFAKHHPETLPRYRRMSSFFLAWSGIAARIRLALGRAEREDVLLYRNMKAILDDIVDSQTQSRKLGGEPTC
jgi:GT2 family glycosyltransferase